MPKTLFKITCRPDGNWQGTREGNEPPIVISHTQALVKTEVFKQARDLGHSRVLVFNSSGDETEERTFGTPRVKGYAGSWD